MLTAALWSTDRSDLVERRRFLCGEPLGFDISISERILKLEALFKAGRQTQLTCGDYEVRLEQFGKPRAAFFAPVEIQNLDVRLVDAFGDVFSVGGRVEDYVLLQELQHVRVAIAESVGQRGRVREDQSETGEAEAGAQFEDTFEVEMLLVPNAPVGESDSGLQIKDLLVPSTG